MSNVYDVVINGISAAAPSDGFIDPMTSYSYMNTAGTAPTNNAAGKAKMRGNRRYKMVIYQVDMMCNAYALSVTTPGADANTAPSSITIRFEVEHGDQSLNTSDELNAGQTLTGAAALKRCVARAMIHDEVRNIEYYDPTVVGGRQIDGSANSGLARGPVINIETIGKLVSNITTAESSITVTKIS